MKDKNKIIGILGGIGPEATGNFYLSLISLFQKRGLINSNTDFPQIIINSIPAPELIYEKISNKDLELYIKGLKELEKFGVDSIAIICNTIHLFYQKLQNKIKTPIIDLRKEIKNFLIEKNVKTITVLGTPITIKKGLYRFESFKYLDLNEEDVKSLAEGIFNFNKGFEKNKQKRTIQNIAKKYLKNGAEIIILGCTELELMLKGVNIPKINTMDILLETIIKRHKF